MHCQGRYAHHSAAANASRPAGHGSCALSGFERPTALRPGLDRRAMSIPGALRRMDQQVSDSRMRPVSNQPTRARPAVLAVRRPVDRRRGRAWRVHVVRDRRVQGPRGGGRAHRSGKPRPRPRGADHAQRGVLRAHARAHQGNLREHAGRHAARPARAAREGDGRRRRSSAGSFAMTAKACCPMRPTRRSCTCASPPTGSPGSLRHATARTAGWSSARRPSAVSRAADDPVRGAPQRRRGRVRRRARHGARSHAARADAEGDSRRRTFVHRHHEQRGPRLRLVCVVGRKCDASGRPASHYDRRHHGPARHRDRGSGGGTDLVAFAALSEERLLADHRRYARHARGLRAAYAGCPHAADRARRATRDARSVAPQDTSSTASRSSARRPAPIP